MFLIEVYTVGKTPWPEKQTKYKLSDVGSPARLKTTSPPLAWKPRPATPAQTRDAVRAADT